MSTPGDGLRVEQSGFDPAGEEAAAAAMAVVVPKGSDARAPSSKQHWIASVRGSTEATITIPLQLYHESSVEVLHWEVVTALRYYGVNVPDAQSMRTVRRPDQTLSLQCTLHTYHLKASQNAEHAMHVPSMQRRNAVSPCRGDHAEVTMQRSPCRGDHAEVTMQRSPYRGSQAEVPMQR
eukprot:365707-Chlamydomonas_euryale.AAC.44